MADTSRIDTELVRALVHPLRVEILEILSERDASPAEMQNDLGHPVGNVSYHTNVLVECGCAQMVGTRQVRGATEHFYRAVPRSFIGHQDWRRVPPSARAAVTVEQLRTFMGSVAAALRSGKIIDRGDSVLNWMVIAVDRVAWMQAGAILETARGQLEAVHDQARKRRKKGGEPLFSMVIGLAGFEAASRKR